MKAILVTGATGKQGGSLIKSLVARKDDPFEILAVTRNPQSGSAKQLTQLSPKIKLVEGDLDNPAEIFQKAHAITEGPIWGVFSVQTIGSQEEAQGTALIDESIRQNVKYFVYSSVDRGGETQSARNPTNVPHFRTKHNIERHLMSKASSNDSMQWFILRPTAFFDNLVPGFFGKVFATCFRVALKGKPLQMVATSDIGYFAAEAFSHPDMYAGQSLSLAGDELTYDQFAEIFERKTGQPIPTTFGFVASMIMASIKDFGYMFTWFREEGYKADIAKLKEMNPNLTNFETWLEKESAFIKK